ncbi:MAG: ROK family protein [Ornithinimicrobium sp.]|uniref:ROK family protein n=1 Tax=Ornithinimicrobium sp. TaxID=1977084 RepID=UPI0026DEE7B6|nr:ROK family protein [Ornithinimicrobium sp.]MDO5738793.1 ROK family protein [Ornithinimicrobium sp.]
MPPVPSPVELPSSARQSTLRETNLSVVMRCICEAVEPISRAGVAAATGMTRSTVSRLVDDLVAGALVEEGKATLSGPGRPPTPLSPARGTVAALGLQVNAAHVVALLIDLRGDVLVESRSEPNLVGSDPDVGLGQLTAHVREVLATAPAGLRVLGAGLALPGLVDASGHRLLKAPNLGWREVEPATELYDVLRHIPLRLGNEATLAAHAVAQPRPGRRGPHRDFVYLSGEIGIGGAIVTDGRVQAGARGFAGEIGHMTYLPDGDACPCGSTGCLERYAGRLAMTTRAGLPPETTLAELGRRAEAGHLGSREAVALAADALGVVLAGVVNLLDVSTIVLGGEIGDLLHRLAPRIEALLRERVMAADWVEVTLSRDHDDVAGATGAALLQLGAVIDDPAAYLDS